MRVKDSPSPPVRYHDSGADDAVIIGRSISDPEQFAVLFRRHAPAIQRYVVRRIGPHAADDVVAETFLTAFRQRTGYRQEQGNALTWLYGIATNLVRRHWRTEVRQLRLLARTGSDPVVEPFTDRIDAALSSASVSARLGAALARLPAAQRDALLLVAWGGLTYDEVAIATSVPLGTVQSRVSRARKRLRQALVVKHSGANRAWVQLEYDHSSLIAIVGDNGADGAHPRAAGGLAGIERRLAAFDGTVAVTSPAGGPTQVTMELPCELSLART